MILSELRRNPISLNSVQEDLLDCRLLWSLNRFAEHLKTFDYSVSPYSESALRKLPEISPDKKVQILLNMDSWCEWIASVSAQSPYEKELALLKMALEKYGFQADQKFWKTLEKGQIVEIYDENMVQTYRTFNFFAITGYSILDISIFEWYLLWDRPRKILDSVAAELNESLETYIPAKRFKTPKHVVREIHNASMTQDFVPRMALAEFLYLGSLRSTKFCKNPKKGFICSSKGELIAVGQKAETIQFI